MSFLRASILSAPRVAVARQQQLVAARVSPASARSMGVMDKVKQTLSSDHPEEPTPGAEQSTADHLSAQATRDAPDEAKLGHGENLLSTRGTAWEETGGQGHTGKAGIKIEEALKGQDVLAEGAKDKPSKQ